MKEVERPGQAGAQNSQSRKIYDSLYVPNPRNLLSSLLRPTAFVLIFIWRQIKLFNYHIKHYDINSIRIKRNEIA